MNTKKHAQCNKLGQIKTQKSAGKSDTMIISSYFSFICEMYTCEGEGRGGEGGVDLLNQCEL